MSVEEEKPRLKPIIEGAETLSLGISMVVAILIGVAIGLGLKKLTGITWLVVGRCCYRYFSRILNVFKAYSKQYKEFEKLAKDPRYNMGKSQKDDDDDDED
jgi:ATP synthase protein I